VSELLAEWGNGSPSARDELIPLVYNQLRKLAAYHMARERPEHSLQATALVNEAYLRLVNQTQVQFPHRAHFFALAATAIRHIVSNYARDRRASKRGGGVRTVSLTEFGTTPGALHVSDDHADLLVAIDEALNRLERVNPRQRAVVECRFFGGMSIEETAVAIGVSPRTVKRDWMLAQAWLQRAMQPVV